MPGSHGGPGHQADLWLAAAVGLFVLAIGYGFTSAASQGAGIAAGILQAVGVAVLAGAMASARSRGLLRAHPVPGVIAGLVIVAVSFLAAAIVAGLAFSTLTALGAGLTRSSPRFSWPASWCWAWRHGRECANCTRVRGRPRLGLNRVPPPGPVRRRPVRKRRRRC